MLKRKQKSLIRLFTRRRRQDLSLERYGPRPGKVPGGRHHSRIGTMEAGQRKAVGGVRVSRLKADGIGPVMVKGHGRLLLGGQVEHGKVKKRRPPRL